MFCPNCGNANQQPNSFCRQCGQYLIEIFPKKKSLSLGGETPQEQIRTNLILNLMSSIVSIVSALLLYLTFWNRGSEVQIVFVIAAFLLAMGGWQLSTFFVGLKLRKHFNQRKVEIKAKETLPKTINSFESGRTKVLLDEADSSDVVPASVTENTTRHLGEKVALPQTEKQPDR